MNLNNPSNLYGLSYNAAAASSASNSLNKNNNDSTSEFTFVDKATGQTVSGLGAGVNKPVTNSLVGAS